MRWSVIPGRRRKRIFLDRVQNHVGVGTSYTIQRKDRFCEVVKVVPIANPCQYDRVPISRNIVDSKDPRVCCNSLLDIDHSSFDDSQTGHDGHGPSKVFGVEDSTVAFNDAFVFQPSQSVGHGTLSQSKRPSEMSMARPSVFTEEFQEHSVCSVQLNRHRFATKGSWISSLHSSSMGCGDNSSFDVFRESHTCCRHAPISSISMET